MVIPGFFSIHYTITELKNIVHHLIDLTRERSGNEFNVVTVAAIKTKQIIAVFLCI